MRTRLEDFKVNIRIQLSGLWTSVMWCYIYGDYFELYVPGKVAGLINGDNLLNRPSELFYATIVMTIPALMIFLSLILNPPLTKWLNIGTGIFFSLFTAWVGISSFSEWRTFYVVLSFLESVLTLIIVLKAWYWPKRDEKVLH